jgi:hypothetical protein
MTRDSICLALRGRRFAPAATILTAMTVLLATAQHACAIVPVNATVASGDFDEGVRITNAQGSRGTGTLFGKMYEADPLNPVGNPQRYLDLCFLTADHVLRPLLPGGIPNDPDNDSYPGGSIYEDSPQYGGNLDPAVQPQAVLNTYLSSVGFRSIGDPTAFTLSAANGVVAKKVVMGDGLSGVGNFQLDAAFAAIRVDLNNPALTAAQKVVLNALTPETLAYLQPAPAGLFPQNLVPAVPFSVEGGYGLSGRFDPAIAAYDYVSHAGVPADEQYGVERSLDNTWTRFVQTQGFYNYTAAQWTLKANAGVGLSGDSGAGLFIDGGQNVGPVLIGDLTAGKMDKLAAGNVGLKLGYSEIGAPLTQAAAQTFVGACLTFTIQVPEPTTAGLCVAAIATLMLRRRSRCI